MIYPHFQFSFIFKSDFLDVVSQHIVKVDELALLLFTGTAESHSAVSTIRRQARSSHIAAGSRG